jgi:hypothetical protein
MRKTKDACPFMMYVLRVIVYQDFKRPDAEWGIENMELRTGGEHDLEEWFCILYSRFPILYYGSHLTFTVPS